MRLTGQNIHKILCGALVVLGLATLPLPALADTSVPDTSFENANVEQAETPVTPPAETPQPTVDTSLPVINEVVSPPVATISTDSLPTEAAQPITPTEVAVSNSVDSTAESGAATVTNNETAGNATSGNAAASATVLNVANANGLTAGNFNTFNCDVHGNVQDNLVIDPTSLLPICKMTSPTAGTVGNAPTTSTQGLQTGASLVDILNNIVLSAASGDASVTGNETAGDAASGDAAALANIVNIANTAIGAKNSFLGVINIYGQLKGDILVPQSLVDSLVNSQAGSSIPGSTTITNNLDAAATSGNATVTNNEAAGNAASGDATTSLTVLNLTGQEVVAKNSLLVFVNVLGKWMGMIVPAPGSSTAMLGGGVQSSTSGVAGIADAGHSAVNITNNVSVGASSGDATVSGNETAGNATSGKAQAGVNVLNITNSNFKLDDWFGALFINVLGSWLGDFDILATTPTTPGTGSAPTQPIQDVKVFEITSPTQVVPAKTVNTTSRSTSLNVSTASTQADNDEAVLATVTTRQDPETSISTNGGKGIHLDIAALMATVMALTMMIATTTMVLRRWHSA